MLPFLQHWKGVGFGLIGAEGIHADFNNLKRRFSGMPDAVKRLCCTVKENHLCCTPQNIALKPPVKKRPKREE